jgi:hypothetical protein
MVRFVVRFMSWPVGRSCVNILLEPTGLVRERERERFYINVLFQPIGP